MEQSGEGEFRTFKNILVPRLGATVISIAALYLGTALMLSHFGQNTLSKKLYRCNTQNNLAILEQTEDIYEANTLADEILKQNTSFFAPYSIKAKYSYAQGDFDAVIQYKKAVFQKRPFDYSEYEEYGKMLLNGIMLYEQAGDHVSAEYCKGELMKIPQMLEANRNRLSRLGSMIDDQPMTELSEEIQKYIDMLGG